MTGAPGFSAPKVDYIAKYHIAVALGLNVLLSIHVDSCDMLISATCVILDGECTDKTLAYFCFSEQGLVISSHCSNRDRFFCISLYPKKDVFGGNDNNAQLTVQQAGIISV